MGQNTEKNLEDLKTLAVIQTPVKDYPLTLAWKTHKTVYGDLKQYGQRKHQQNKNDKKTKMGRKTTAYTF